MPRTLFFHGTSYSLGFSFTLVLLKYSLIVRVKRLQDALDDGRFGILLIILEQLPSFLDSLPLQRDIQILIISCT